MFTNVKCKEWWKAAGVRAVKTVCQTLGATIPVGFVITPAMVESADWSLLYIVAAWLGTGLLAGVAAFITSLGGLPECSREVIEAKADLRNDDLEV